MVWTLLVPWTLANETGYCVKIKSCHHIRMFEAVRNRLRSLN